MPIAAVEIYSKSHLTARIFYGTKGGGTNSICSMLQLLQTGWLKKFLTVKLYSINWNVCAFLKCYWPAIMVWFPFQGIKSFKVSFSYHFKVIQKYLSNTVMEKLLSSILFFWVQKSLTFNLLSVSRKIEEGWHSTYEIKMGRMLFLIQGFSSAGILIVYETYL